MGKESEKKMNISTTNSLCSIAETNCCCSVAKSCLTLWDPMDYSMPCLPVLHYLPEFAQGHVHSVGNAV